MNKIIPIQNMIYELRGYKVMLDSDLAFLYQVETKYLNRIVKRNLARFPEDFMFQLSKDEWEAIKVRCQIVTSLKGGGRQYLPYAFTEQGVAMLSGLLNSNVAIEINIQIMRTFVKLRQFAIENKELATRISELEHYFIDHVKENKEDTEKIYKALEYLMDVTRPVRIGF